MAIHIQRRKFIGTVGSVVAWPLAVRAQQPAMPVIGFLGVRSPAEAPHLVAAFRQGLHETGYVEGQNVVIEYRWAENQYDRLPTLVADLVARQVAVIAATGGGVSPLAAKAATRTIPIVFVTGDLDPVNSGLVSSLNRPGGNITGVMLLLTVLGSKRLELLRQIVPNAAVIGVLMNPTNPGAAGETKELHDAAHALGMELHVLSASTDGDLDATFATFVQQRVGALLIDNDSFFISRREDAARGRGGIEPGHRAARSGARRGPAPARVNQRHSRPVEDRGRAHGASARNVFASAGDRGCGQDDRADGDEKRQPPRHRLPSEPWHHLCRPCSATRCSATPRSSPARTSSRPPGPSLSRSFMAPARCMVSVISSPRSIARAAAG